MTPGKQKRGKAAKQAIEVFSRARDTPPSHKGLIKGVTDNECVQAMIGDVKVAVAGLAQATQVTTAVLRYKYLTDAMPFNTFPFLSLRPARRIDVSSVSSVLFCFVLSSTPVCPNPFKRLHVCLMCARVESL